MRQGCGGDRLVEVWTELARAVPGV